MSGTTPELGRSPREVAAAELRHVLREGAGAVVLSGCLGIGKSFLAKAAAKGYLADSVSRGVGIYLGLGAEKRPRRQVAVYVPKSDDWIDALGGIQLGSEVTLPGKLTLPMLLAPPRQWAGILVDLHESGIRVVIILDQHALDICEGGYTREDIEALAAMRAAGIQVIAEFARPKTAGEEVDPIEASLVKNYVPVRVRCPTGPEARALARRVAEMEAVLAAGDRDAIESYAGEVVALVGTHPGSIVALIKEASVLVDLREAEIEFGASTGDLLATACEKAEFRRYLSLRWSALTEEERITACLVAIAESSRSPFREILKWWSGAMGKAEGDEVKHMDTAEFMQESDCLIGGGREEPRISGAAVRDFINRTSQAREIRATIGVVLPEQPSFDFARFLGLWLIAIIWYFVASITSWALESWVLGIPSHSLIVPVFLLAGFFLPGWWVARHYLRKRRKRSS